MKNLNPSATCRFTGCSQASTGTLGGALYVEDPPGKYLDTLNFKLRTRIWGSVNWSVNVRDFFRRAFAGKHNWDPASTFENESVGKLSKCLIHLTVPRRRNDEGRELTVQEIMSMHLRHRATVTLFGFPDGWGQLPIVQEKHQIWSKYQDGMILVQSLQSPDSLSYFLVGNVMRSRNPTLWDAEIFSKRACLPWGLAKYQWHGHS